MNQWINFSSLNPRVALTATSDEQITTTTTTGETNPIAYMNISQYNQESGFIQIYGVSVNNTLLFFEVCYYRLKNASPDATCYMTAGKKKIYNYIYIYIYIYTTFYHNFMLNVLSALESKS